MNKKKRLIYTSIIAIALLVYAAFGIVNYFKGADDRAMQALGNELIEKVKEYRIEHGKLPATLSDIGLPDGEEGSFMFEGNPFFYSIWNDSVFRVEYPIDMERNMGRQSDQEDWEVNYVVYIRR